jgi:hypothetical protein
MLQLLRAEPGIRRVEKVDDVTLRLSRTGPADVSTVFLSTIFGEVRSLEGVARSERMQCFVRAMAAERDVPAAWVGASRQVMPAVRAVGWAVGTPAEAEPPLRWPFVPFVVRQVVVDDDHAMAYVQRQNLEDWVWTRTRSGWPPSGTSGLPPALHRLGHRWCDRDPAPQRLRQLLARPA